MMWCEAMYLQRKLAEDHAVDAQQAAEGQQTLSDTVCSLDETLPP